jgi:hypothetical protein
MEQGYDITGMTAKIKALRKTATELKTISGGIQAVDRNVDRILANVRMLELDVAEITGLLKEK